MVVAQRERGGGGRGREGQPAAPHEVRLDCRPATAAAGAEFSHAGAAGCHLAPGWCPSDAAPAPPFPPGPTHPVARGQGPSPHHTLSHLCGHYGDTVSSRLCVRMLGQPTLPPASQSASQPASPHLRHHRSLAHRPRKARDTHGPSACALAHQLVEDGLHGGDANAAADQQESLVPRVVSRGRVSAGRLVGAAEQRRGLVPANCVQRCAP